RGRPLKESPMTKLTTRIIGSGAMFGLALAAGAVFGAEVPHGDSSTSPQTTQSEADSVARPPGTVPPFVKPTTPHDVAASPPTSTSPPAKPMAAISKAPKFEDLDLNHDGSIQRNELSATMDADSMLLKYDRNGDGKLSRGEYASYLADRRAYARMKAASTPP